MGMIKEKMKYIKEIKNDVKGNNLKIDEVAVKVDNLETKQKATDEKNEQTFQEIKGDKGKVEVRVANKIMAEIEPSLSVMKEDIQTSIGADLRRLVQEEVTIQRLKEAKERDDAVSDPDVPESNKNKKIQKNIKL